MDTELVNSLKSSFMNMYDNGYRDCVKSMVVYMKRNSNLSVQQLIEIFESSIENADTAYHILKESKPL